jgi:hypothetical protein
MKDKVINIAQYKYDQAENELRMKLVEYSERPEIQSQIGEAFYIWKDDPDFIPDEITDAEIDDFTFEKFFDWFLHDFRLLDTGERVIERFYNDEAAALSPAEETILKGWLDSVYSFFEVGEVAPGEYCDIKDLFLNKEFRVHDSSSSKKLKTSDIIGARPLSAGENTYFSGVVSAYPAAFKNIIIEYFESGFEQYGKARGDRVDKKGYLRDMGFQISSYLEDLASNPHFITPEGEDLVLASAVYGVNDRDTALEKLGEIKSLKEISGPGDELRIFIMDIGGRSNISGTLEVDDERISIETYSIEMLERAKSVIERGLQGLIVHLEDKTKGMESYTDRSKKANTKLQRLPSGVKSRKELDRELDEYYASWVDLPHPSLNGLSPREAAKTSEGRKGLNIVLSELENIYKHAGLRGEPSFDVAKLRKELKLI